MYDMSTPAASRAPLRHISCEQPMAAKFSFPRILWQGAKLHICFIEKNASNRHNTIQDIMHAEGPYMGNVDRVSMRQKHLIWAAVAGQLKTEQGAGAETLARRAAEHAGRIGRNGAGEEAMARNGGLARVKAAVQATHRCSELEREATVRQVATVYVPDA